MTLQNLSKKIFLSLLVIFILFVNGQVFAQYGGGTGGTTGGTTADTTNTTQAAADKAAADLAAAQAAADKAAADLAAAQAAADKAAADKAAADKAAADKAAADAAAKLAALLLPPAIIVTCSIDSVSCSGTTLIVVTSCSDGSSSTDNYPNDPSCSTPICIPGSTRNVCTSNSCSL